MRKATLACLAVGICASLALPSIATAQDFPPASRFQKVTLNDRPGEPMSLAVLPDGRVLHSARTGEIRIHNPRTGLNTLAADMRESPEGLYLHDEEGVQGIALDPRFQNNRWVYVYYSPRLDTPVDDPATGGAVNEGDAPYHARDRRGPRAAPAVRRAPAALALQAGRERARLRLRAADPRACRSDRGICCHVGGKIDFDGQGNLYLSTGDDTNPFESGGYSPIDERDTRNPAFDAQRTSANTNDLRGKILRIRVTTGGDYSVPSGNLFRPGQREHAARDLRDGLPQPVPHVGRQEVRQRLRRRLLAGRGRGGSGARARGLRPLDARGPARQLWLAVLHDPQPRLHRLRLRDRGVGRRVQLPDAAQRVAEQHGPAQPARHGQPGRLVQLPDRGGPGRLRRAVPGALPGARGRRHRPDGRAGVRLPRQQPLGDEVAARVRRPSAVLRVDARLREGVRAQRAERRPPRADPQPVLGRPGQQPDPGQPDGHGVRA